MKGRALHLTVALFLTTLFFSKSIAQNTSELREYFVEAESYFLFEEYVDALPLYQRILAQDPENYNVKYKIGICYLNDPYQFNRSVDYLEDASKHINSKYKVNNFKERLAPPDVIFYLGQAYRKNNDIEKAVIRFNEFKNTVDPEIFDFAVVNDELSSCKSAIKQQKNPVYEVSTNLGDAINSRFAETRPVISGDGKTLVFTRKLQFYDGVFLSHRKSDGSWTSPENLTPFLGLDGNSYTTGISYSGDEILVYRSDNFDGNIYSSKKVDGEWQPLVKLGDNINTKYWESHASFSPDGKSLYFTSNRRGGYGGLDIYRSERNPDGSWGEAVNLGPIVNSPSNEDTPFMSPKDNKLFFSSLDHNGMGGYDIFITELIGPGKWSKPINMGYPFNTTDDNLFFCPVSIENYTGIWSNYNKETTYGLMDLCWAEVYNEILPREFKLSGTVSAADLKLLADKNITATLIDTKQGKIVGQASVDEAGNYSINTLQGEYQLLIDGEGIDPVTVPIVLKYNQESDIIEIPEITALASKKNEPEKDFVIVPPPMLKVVGETYILTDTTPIIIELALEPDAKLSVEINANNELINKEEFVPSNSRFVYRFEPQSGENTIVFTLTDKEGKMSQEEVLIYFTENEGIEEEPLSVEDTLPEIPIGISELSLMAGGNLGDFLLSLGNTQFDDKAQLYNLLIANADENNYTIDDVNKLFALMLTQRNKEEFLSDIYGCSEFENIRLTDSILDPIDFPINIVETTRGVFVSEVDNINRGLVKVIPFNGSEEAELDYILSFANSDYTGRNTKSVINKTDFLDEINQIVSEEASIYAINMASTTVNLDFLLQCLLLVSEGALHDYISNINYYEDDIQNAVDLVNVLLNNADSHHYTIEDVINSIDEARNNREQNINLFKEALSINAKGNLKTAIEGLPKTSLELSTYEKIIDELISSSRTGGYSPEEFYQLLVDMIGISNVNDFKPAFAVYASQQLDSLIKSSENQHFSTPLELIQFLLTQAPYFDYTESDINNILLRMLLEKGVNQYLEEGDVLQSEKLIRRRKISITLIFANAFIIIILIIIWRRKKQNQKK